MKNLFPLILITLIHTFSFAQNPCEFVNITRPACTETTIRLDNTAFFNFPPNNAHVYSWMLGTTINNNLFQSTDEDFILDLTTVGITTVDSIDVTLTVTNSLGQTCITRDTFVWEVVAVVIGTPIFSWEALNQNSGILPVELLDFNGSMMKEDVQLNWSTTSELYNEGFEIQKSKNNNDWQNISFVEGSGNSSTRNDYKYTDKNPYSGVNYYRLNQIDFDGKSEYSNTITVANNKSTINDIVSVYPNPSMGEVNITPSNNVDLIEIIDPLGKVIKQYKALEKHQNIKVNLETRGLYLIRIKSEDQLKTQKLLIQ